MPVNTDTEVEQSSTITYAPEVINIITSAAVNEVEGIAGMSSASGGLLTRKSNSNKGIRVELSTEEVSIDLYVIVEYDRPIQKVAQEVQENVRKAIESMTGLHVVRVDVHVQGVSFEKENSALADGAKNAVIAENDEEKLTSAAAETEATEETSEEA
ncbi:MAG: Asp23/Gls24 family envelope stress response protein [Clostridia bacterium]|nr:Asp23/Gls24 family envelope stress response protein [Clostridia bacterium]